MAMPSGLSSGDDACEASSLYYMNLQVMSDLHLETPRLRPMYSEFHLTPQCGYLALLGDIGTVQDERLFDFIELQLQQFSVVYYVFGNHEPYETSHQQAVSKMQHFEGTNAARRATGLRTETSSLPGEFVFLNRRRHDLSDRVTILGCTLFSNIFDEQKSTASLFVSDFSNIDGWNVELHNTSHRGDLAWLDNQVESISHNEPDRVIVILTHYSPTVLPEANDPEHLEDSRGIQSAFVTDLTQQKCWNSSSVKLWAFGHTHYNCDFVDTRTGKMVVANQRGYGREDIFDFDPDKTVTVKFDQTKETTPYCEERGNAQYEKALCMLQ